MRQNHLIFHEIFSQKAWGNNHPLAISRISSVFDIIKAMGWFHLNRAATFSLPSIELIKEFHDKEYVDVLSLAAKSLSLTQENREKFNFGNFENPLFDGFFDRALATVGGSIKAAQLAATGSTVFHPGGGTHHGKQNKAAGFCYLNDPVFAILELKKQGIERIAYIDIDAHHGDGVENAFENDDNVLTLSIHEGNRFPYSGEFGVDLDRAFVNIPIPQYVNDSEYSLIIDHCLPIISNFAPHAMVITAGADCLKGDPLSKMQLSNSLFLNTVNRLLQICEKNVVLGGGGYNPWNVARTWAALWGMIGGFDFKASINAETKAILLRFQSDLIDSDEIEPHWLSGLIDPSNQGQIRTEIVEICNRIKR